MSGLKVTNVDFIIKALGIEAENPETESPEEFFRRMRQNYLFLRGQGLPHGLDSLPKEIEDCILSEFESPQWLNRFVKNSLIITGVANADDPIFVNGFTANPEVYQDLIDRLNHDQKSRFDNVKNLVLNRIKTQKWDIANSIIFPVLGTCIFAFVMACLPGATGAAPLVDLFITMSILFYAIPIALIVSAVVGFFITDMILGFSRPPVSENPFKIDFMFVVDDFLTKGFVQPLLEMPLTGTELSQQPNLPSADTPVMFSSNGQAAAAGRVESAVQTEPVEPDQERCETGFVALKDEMHSGFSTRFVQS